MAKDNKKEVKPVVPLDVQPTVQETTNNNVITKTAYSPYDSQEFKTWLDDVANSEYPATIAFTTSYKKPVAPDEKKIARASALGSIGDTLGLIAQSYSAGNGAHIRNRDYNDFASPSINKRIADLYNKYDLDTKEYNRELFNNRLQGWKQARDDYYRWLNRQDNLLASQQKADIEAQKAKQQQANLDRDYNLRKDKQIEDSRHSKEMEKLQRQSINLKNGARDKDKNVPFFIPLNPNDTNSEGVTIGQFGEKGRRYELPNEEIGYYFDAAVKSGFLNRHPEYADFTTQDGISYIPSPKKGREQDIVRGYLEELYNKKFENMQGPDLNSFGFPININPGSPGWIFNPDNFNTPSQATNTSNNGTGKKLIGW